MRDFLNQICHKVQSYCFLISKLSSFYKMSLVVHLKKKAENSVLNILAVQQPIQLAI